MQKSYDDKKRLRQRFLQKAAGILLAMNHGQQKQLRADTYQAIYISTETEACSTSCKSTYKIKNQRFYSSLCCFKKDSILIFLEIIIFTLKKLCIMHTC